MTAGKIEELAFAAMPFDA